MDYKINVTHSSMPDFREYCEEIKELWDSHWLTNNGVKHRQLEDKLKQYLNTYIGKTQKRKRILYVAHILKVLMISLIRVILRRSCYSVFLPMLMCMIILSIYWKDRLQVRCLSMVL